MNENHRMKSSVATELESFIHEYHIKGFKNRGVFETLRMLDNYLYSINHMDKVLSTDVFKKWLESMAGVCNTTLYSRACIGRRFIKYLNDLGYESQIPLLPRRYGSDFTPYVFSHEEMERIFRACDEYRDPGISYRTPTFMFPAIIRVLYSTGMRIGEALNIKNRDVDFDQHLIKLGVTKNNRERLCPINPSLEDVLRQYIGYRGKLRYENHDDPDKYFFVGMSGEKSKSNRIWQRFHNVLVQLDIRDHINGGYPRLHDLRHTACVHAMKKLIEKGKDIYCHVGVLSAFLGHVKIKDTENYIRLTQDMYPELLKQDAVVTKAIHSVIKRSLIVKDYEEETD